MKAQAALLEVLLSFVILASLSSFAANMLYAAPTAQRSYDFNIGNALYDFESVLYRNSTVRACFVAADPHCELGIAENLSIALSLRCAAVGCRHGSEERIRTALHKVSGAVLSHTEKRHVQYAVPICV